VLVGFKHKTLWLRDFRFCFPPLLGAVLCSRTFSSPPGSGGCFFTKDILPCCFPRPDWLNLSLDLGSRACPPPPSRARSAPPRKPRVVTRALGPLWGFHPPFCRARPSNKLPFSRTSTLSPVGKAPARRWTHPFSPQLPFSFFPPLTHLLDSCFGLTQIR